MKIYGIFNGEYSGWDVLGYYTDRKEAEKRCAIKNKKCGYSDEYIIELKCLDGKVKVPKDNLYYLHEVVFDNYNNTWVMRNEPTRYEYSTEEFAPRGIKEGCSWVAIFVKSRQGKTGRKKVEKIAQDRLYQYLALKKGI